VSKGFIFLSGEVLIGVGQSPNSVISGRLLFPLLLIVESSLPDKPIDPMKVTLLDFF
jgi:hypothetical protein